MPQIPLRSRTARYVAIFTAGFVLGSAFMATPALGILLMFVGIVFLGIWIHNA